MGSSLFPSVYFFVSEAAEPPMTTQEMGFRGDNVTTAPLSVATATRKQKHRPASRRSGGLAVEPRNQTRLGEKCSHASV